MINELLQEASQLKTIFFFFEKELEDNCLLVKNSAGRLYVIGRLDDGKVFVEKPCKEFENEYFDRNYKFT